MPDDYRHPPAWYCLECRRVFSEAHWSGERGCRGARNEARIAASSRPPLSTALPRSVGSDLAAGDPVFEEDGF